MDFCSHDNRVAGVTEAGRVWPREAAVRNGDVNIRMYHIFCKLFVFFKQSSRTD